ncbi:hypothetical protein U1Q18_000396 [Sarracenia purpurea var. burkii]
MDKSKKSQVLKLSLLTVLLIIAPLLPPSLRPTYLYFVFNLVVLSLGAESGLLKFFPNSEEEIKSESEDSSESPLHDEGPVETNTSGDGATALDGGASQPNAVGECSSEKIVGGGGVKVKKVKKSIFFVGGGETEEEEEEDDEEDEEEEEEEEEMGGLSGQELFNKAETFIGNFYKQLKMQREESWNRIHEFYQRAF